jgi:two-component system chemotaxis sensor kinase CheA
MKTSDLTEVFRLEARELLDSIEQALLDLKHGSDNRELVDSTFRGLHTLKGSGAMFGFDEVAAFVHEFETAFDRIRKGEAPISPELISIALSAKDHVHKLIEEPGRHAADGSPILEALRQIVADPQLTNPSLSPAAIEVPSGPAARPTSWRIRFYLPDDALTFGTNPFLLLEELRELGPLDVSLLTDRVPSLDVIVPETSYLGWDVKLLTSAPRSAIEDVFLFLRDGMELSIDVEGDAPAAASPKNPHGESQVEQASAAAKPPHRDQPQAHSREAAARAKAGSSLRVPAERLDELMDRVGELVIAQARLSQIAGASDDLNLKAVAEELERLSSGLRDTTMGIRMVPFGTLFGRFRRLVHDLSLELGKQVEFVTSGEETELDKTVIERLADPLVHLIRNSIDHGLEGPGQRIAAGKPAGGTVKLSAVHTGATVAISIVDDGAGLKVDRIRAKAEEAGLISPDAKIPDNELFQFVFHPGFSTAKEITSVSGRGVGMDVVKRTIETLRGTIDIATRPGGGTTVTLKLPLTLAIIDGMLVRVGNGRYTIPLSAVEECVELPASEIAEGQGRSFLNIRGALVPYLRLRQVFKTKSPADPHQKVVIVSSGDFRVGLVVDQIIGNNQTVIKSLSKLHSDVGSFSGATILGDGTVALILDVAHLVNFSQQHEDRTRGERIGRAA